MLRRVFPLLSIVLLGFVFASCDAVGEGEDTITLSSESNGEFDPIAYTFQYGPNDFTDGELVLSENPSGQDLDTPLKEIAAASRSDIQSAEVTKVTFRRVSSGSSAETSKVFGYLSRAEVRLSSRSGPQIAISDPAPDPSNNRPVEMTLGSGASSVGDVLKQDAPTSAVLNLEVENPNDVNDFDAIEVEIDYSITVR